MNEVISELREIISVLPGKFNSFSEEEFSRKPAPGKWSPKEVLGHLIDSAHNNLRRFITGQYEASPPHILYDQDFWVNAQGYQAASKEEIVTLWRLLNGRIAEVLTRMPAAHYKKECNTGRGKDELHTIEWLAADYIKHMKHHLNQIIPRSFPVTYP